MMLLSRQPDRVRLILPDHPYVPGQSARPSEAKLRQLSPTPSGTVTCTNVFETEAWALGGVLFDRRYFWEAHEVWEPLWLVLPGKSPQRLAVQAAIQLANAALKREMERPKAVQRLCAQVRTLVDQLPQGIWETSGLQEEVLVQWLADLEKCAI